MNLPKSHQNLLKVGTFYFESQFKSILVVAEQLSSYPVGTGRKRMKKDSVRDNKCQGAALPTPRDLFPKAWPPLRLVGLPQIAFISRAYA